MHILENKLLQMIFIFFILHNFEYNKNLWMVGKLGFKKYLVGVNSIFLMMVPWIFISVPPPLVGNLNEIVLIQFMYTCKYLHSWCTYVNINIVSFSVCSFTRSFVYIQFADRCKSAHSFRFSAYVIHTFK